MTIRDAERDHANRSLATRLAGAALGMFAFGYALVPLYDVFCELTGLGGKTGREAAVTAGGAVPEQARVLLLQRSAPRARRSAHLSGALLGVSADPAGGVHPDLGLHL